MPTAASTESERVPNVRDGRHGCIGEWQVEPLIYQDLTEADIGRTVIYRDHGRAEAGTLSSFRDGRVWARFSRGDTAAACDPRDLSFAVTTMHPVESSSVESIGHDGAHLHVKFKNGHTYQFHDVPPETFEAARTAESIGRFINAHVKGKHPSTKLEAK